MFGMIGVARHVRAWIETPWERSVTLGSLVARHVRAWIETINAMPPALHRWSPATCGRGLKPVPCAAAGPTSLVARHVRAWIET